MSEKKTPIKKVKLNYMSAVSRTPPKARIPVSSARMEELDKAIREKTKQNTDQFNMAREKKMLKKRRTRIDFKPFLFFRHIVCCL